MTHTPTPAHQPGMTGGSMSEHRSAESDASQPCAITIPHESHVWGSPEYVREASLVAGVDMLRLVKPRPTCPGVPSDLWADERYRSLVGYLRHSMPAGQAVADLDALLAARTADLRAERDAARREERMRAEDHARAWREVEALRDVVERVEALAKRWEPLPGRPESWWRVGAELRAALTARRHEEA